RELQHMGVPVTSHSNTVEDRLADQLRSKLGVYGGDEVVARDEAPVEEEHVEVAPEVNVEATPAPPVEEVKPAEPGKPHVPPTAPAPPPEPRIEAKPEIKPESRPAAPPVAPVAHPPAAAAPPIAPPIEHKPVIPQAPPPPPAPAPRYHETRGLQFVEPKAPV